MMMAAGEAEPPAPAVVLQFTFTPDQTSATAAGFNTPLNESFTHDGRTFTITRCFTHNNGNQIRFATNGDALQFIAEDFLVDTGIAGQQPYRSSLMRNISAINAAQYDAYAGRFVGGQQYTVTISA